MQSKVDGIRWLRKLAPLAMVLAALFLGLTSLRAGSLTTDAPAGGTSTTSMPNAGEVTVSSTYELSPYDVIDVSVYGEEDLHTRARLGADGSVLLPLIGNVDLSGKTVTEANDLIKKKYADGGYVKDPHILLSVVEYRKSTFSIIGQVSRPGIYEIPEGMQMSIVDAVLLAGGFTRVADQNGVKVKRVVKGKATVTTVKAGAMSTSTDVAPFLVKPGDVITVKERWW